MFEFVEPWLYFAINAFNLVNGNNNYLLHSVEFSCLILYFCFATLNLGWCDFRM